MKKKKKKKKPFDPAAMDSGLNPAEAEEVKSHVESTPVPEEAEQNDSIDDLGSFTLNSLQICKFLFLSFSSVVK